MHAQVVSPLKRWSATIELLPVIAMIIFIKYPLNDQRFKQISDEAEARKRTVIKAHHEDQKTFVTSNFVG
jgi:Na+/melibiose symporter-like transporter